MDRNLAATYTLIYTFLTQRSLTKTAQALKKEVKDVVALNDGVKPEGPSLEVILKQWKLQQAQKKGGNPMSSSDSSSSDSDSSSTSKSKKKAQQEGKAPAKNSQSSSDSSDSSDSDSSSGSKSNDESNDSDSSTSKPKRKQRPPKILGGLEREISKTLSSTSSKNENGLDSASGPNSSSGSNSSSSAASDSDSSSDSETSSGSTVKIKKKLGAVKAGTKRKRSGDSSSSGSGSDSSSSSSEDSEDEKSKTVDIGKKTAEPPSSNSSSHSSSGSSSSDDSASDPDTDSEPDKKAPVKHTQAQAQQKESRRNEGIEEQQVPTKKRKISAGGAAITIANADSLREGSGGSHPSGSGTSGHNTTNNDRKGRQIGARFQRIKLEVASSDVIMDSSYEAKGGPANDYGQRAHTDLIVTRGAGFRKEKNKKKKGSYKGGEITLNSHSFKFLD